MWVSDFRSLTHGDFPLLLEWLQRPHVKEWWDDGDDTLAKVTAHYSRDPENTKRFMAELDGQAVGYFQYHRFSVVHVGTDQFLADASLLSKGVGTTFLQAFVDLIGAREQCQWISVDPHPMNKRAIRCYEKCGFVQDPGKSKKSLYYMSRRMFR
jgi:aminoglycoside 6'-N-acetyltransferase